MKMVDVSGKERTERVAIATARLGCSRRREDPAPARWKGDVLAAARLAG
jgi:molybdenum cofactor biosynthesis enzyme